MPAEDLYFMKLKWSLTWENAVITYEVSVKTDWVSKDLIFYLMYLILLCSLKWTQIALNFLPDTKNQICDN